MVLQASARIIIKACPRCNGAIVSYSSAYEDSFCVNCGWERIDIPQSVIETVESSRGQGILKDERWTHRSIGTGKAPSSGWQKQVASAHAIWISSH